MGENKTQNPEGHGKNEEIHVKVPGTVVEGRKDSINTN
jgi:hypothetical protein